MPISRRQSFLQSLNIKCTESHDKSNKKKIFKRPKIPLYKTLYAREIEGKLPRDLPMQLYRSVPRNLNISLKNIITLSSLMKGHIFFGFSRDGNYILSYRCKYPEDDRLSLNGRHKYYIYWWKINLSQRAEKVHRVELFYNEEIFQQLLLILVDPPCGDYMVVSGNSRNEVGTELSGYMSLFPNWNRSQQRKETTFLYQLSFCYELPPYYFARQFAPSFNLEIENAVVINRGDTLICVYVYFPIKKNNDTSNQQYFNSSMTSEVDINTLISECCFDKSCQQKSNDIDLQFNGYFTSSNIQVFSSSPVHNGSNHADCTDGSLLISAATLNGLPLYAIQQHSCDKEYSDCHGYTKDFYNNADVVTKQVQLKIDSFIHSLFENSPIYKDIFVALRDYDINMIEACRSTKVVMLLVNASVYVSQAIDTKETKNEAKGRSSLTTGFTLLWHLDSGLVEVACEHEFNQTLKRQSSSTCPSTFLAARKLNKKWKIPSLLSQVSIQYTNENTFRDESLKVLKHPLYPIAIVL